MGFKAMHPQYQCRALTKWAGVIKQIKVANEMCPVDLFSFELNFQMFADIKIYSGSPLICSNDFQLSQSGPKEFNFVFFFLSWKNLPLKRRLMIWMPLKKDRWDGYFLLLVTFLLTCCRLFFLWRTWARSTCVKQNGSWFTHVNHLICKKKLLRVYVRVLWIEQRLAEFLLATRPWKGVLKYLISFSRPCGRRKFNMPFAHFMALWHALKKISSFITRVLRST